MSYQQINKNLDDITFHDIEGKSSKMPHTEQLEMTLKSLRTTKAKIQEDIFGDFSKKKSKDVFGVSSRVVKGPVSSDSGGKDWLISFLIGGMKH